MVLSSAIAVLCDTITSICTNTITQAKLAKKHNPIASHLGYVI